MKTMVMGAQRGRMTKLLAKGLLGLALALGVAQGVVPAAAAVTKATAGWKFAGKYGSYKAACKKAAYLEEQGYETCIKQEGNTCWCVYCRPA